MKSLVPQVHNHPFTKKQFLWHKSTNHPAVAMLFFILMINEKAKVNHTSVSVLSSLDLGILVII